MRRKFRSRSVLKHVIFIEFKTKRLKWLVKRGLQILRALAEIDIWLVAITTAYWAFLISEISVRLILAVIVGLTSSLLYYFIIKREEKKVKLIRIIYKLSPEILLAMLFIALLITFLIPPINNNIYFKNWCAIPATNWIKFFVVNAFCTFLPGFILVKLADRENKLPTHVCIVLAVLLSVFFTSLFWYSAKRAALHTNLVNIIFVIANFTLILAYICKKKRKRDKTDLPRMLNLNSTITLFALVIFSATLVYIQQFVYFPFIKGDNWGYLSVSNYIEKGLFFLEPVGKFYRVYPPYTYPLYISALFHLSDFPPVNSMMITSLVVASLVPIAFYGMSFKYTKDRKVSILSTFIYVAISGFGWWPFLFQKIGMGEVNYSAQDFLFKFQSIAPKVLNDISQPQGAIPEGFKTYVLANLALIMLLYLLESDLSFKVRSFLIAAMTAFAFLVHIEEASIIPLTFLLAHVLSSKKKAHEIMENIIAVGIGFLITFMIELTYPNHFVDPLKVNYITVTLVLELLFSYTFIQKKIKIRLLDRKFGFLKLVLLCLICYFYIFSIITLALYGYENMYYGSLVVYKGFTFPWYYYPLSFGVGGILLIAGFAMKFQKKEGMIFSLLSIMLLLIFGRFISFINVNFFFTGTKEWRILYRVMPIPVSIFAGWAFYKLFYSLRSAKLHMLLTKNSKSFQFRLRSASTLLFILLIILGIPSTILASEYWMMTDATDLGRIYVTSEDLEAANFIYQSIPMTSRMATLSSRSNAVIKLAGGTTAIPQIYPDILSSTRPETLALLSSDLGFLYLDKESDLKSVSRGLLDLLTLLPLVFNNSKVSIYELPYLEPPTNSNVGYVAPQIYTNNTLISYMIVASLNSSYEMVYDDIYDKSMLILPSDLPRTRRYVLNFEGANNYIDLGDAMDIGSEDLTVEVWFKTSASGKFMSLVNKRRSGLAEAGYRIVIRGDTNRIHVELNDGNGTITAVGQAHNDGRWHHVVAVFDREDKLKLYVDGELEAQADISGKKGNINTDCPLTLGSQEHSTMFFEGRLSSFRIYNRALSESEIRLNLADPDNPVTKGLVIWLPLDEGTGNVAHDMSVNKNDGLIYGTNWILENIPFGTIYYIQSQKLINWVKDGGTIVVLGGSRMFYKLCGLQYGDYTKANEISIGNTVYSLNETLHLRTLLTTDNGTRVLSYYLLNGFQVCPLAIQKSQGKGNIIYIYIEPINHMVSAQPEQLSYISCIIKHCLENAGIRFPESSEVLARFPLRKRWMGRYLAYGENSFIAEGNVTITSQLSGSYFAFQPLVAEELAIKSAKAEKYENITIKGIEVLGFAELEICSERFELHKLASIPSYIPCKFKNVTIKIEPLNGSKIEIESEDGCVYSSEEEVVIKARSATFQIKNPDVYVKGSINFTKVSLPCVSDAWAKNIQVVGNLMFHIDYSDENYFFCDKFEGMYTVKAPPRYPKVEENVPWQNIVLSPLHILVIACLFYIMLKLRKIYSVM